MIKEDNQAGERLETHITNETMLEHLHRYAVAATLAKGKTVLDIACGEGYGCHLLSAGAEKVTGVDISTAVIEKASAKYNNPKIGFRTGSITGIPAADKSFDVITCFETIEHIDEHETAMKELKRVLKPGGILIISTPDKANYSDKTGYNNPFHKKELYQEQFRALVNSSFPFTAFCSQNSLSASVIQTGKSGQAEIYSGDFNRTETVIEPMYWIAFASDNEFSVPGSSIFADKKNMTQQLAALEKALKNTITYRTGHLILAPFKFLRSVFKR